MDLLGAALEYAQAGYRVFPLLAGEKRPATGHGCLDATQDEAKIEAWWESNPDYNIGISTNGLLVVDVDGKNNPWLHELGPERHADLMACPAAWTANGGQHFFFRQPLAGGFRNTASRLADQVDTRADGGYVVAAPSTLANGGGYVWFPERELPDLVNLGQPPTWLVEALAGDGGEQAKPGRRTAVSKPGEPIPSGQRNEALFKQACAMRRVGFTAAEIEVAIQRANAARCQPPLEPTEVTRIAGSAASYVPTDDAAWSSPEPLGQPKSSTFPPELLNVPGFVGEVVALNLSTAPRKQPVLALAGALALLAVLTGRKIQDAAGLRTNVYLLGVAASGSGKEHARKINKAILFRSGGEALLGGETAKSGAGIQSAIATNPAQLFQFDEVGRLLEHAAGRNAPPHLAEILTVLMKLYSSADSAYTGELYADAKRGQALQVDQPHVVLYATSVPDNLYGSLTAASLTDGFVSRLLIFESEDAAPDHGDGKPIVVPADLLAFARSWIDKPCGPGDLADIHPEPEVWPIAADALELLHAFRGEAVEHQRATDGFGALWSRAYEKARKLALLHAASRTPGNAPFGGIDREAAAWGVAMARHLTSKLVDVGDQHVAETTHQRECQRVLQMLREAGGQMAMRDVRRKMRHLKKSEREAVFESLADYEAVGIWKQAGPNGGRPTEVIYLAK